MNRTGMVVLIMALTTLASSQNADQSEPGSYTELQAYLQLSDAQLQALLNIQRQQDQDLQPRYQTIGGIQAQVRQLLSSDNPAAIQIGQLEIQIVQLQKELAAASKPYRDQSFALLSADKQSMLPRLADSLLLNSLATEAVSLRLIDNPAVIGAVSPQSGGVASAPRPSGGRIGAVGRR